MPRPSRKFEGLLTDAPRPLPDDDEPQPAELTDAERPEPAAAAPEQTSAPEAAVAAATSQGEPGSHGSRPKSAGPVASAETSSAGTAREAPAARTVRLHGPAAEALNSAWLDQRMHVNPKLSYPEFASEIVRLGLAAFKRKADRSLT